MKKITLLIGIVIVLLVGCGKIEYCTNYDYIIDDKIRCNTTYKDGLFESGNKIFNNCDDGNNYINPIKYKSIKACE